MSRLKQVLGLDQKTATGTLDVQVRYLDGSGDDGDASGIGFLNVSPRGLVWKIDGFNVGNRDWLDVTSWVHHAADAGHSQLTVTFEGLLQVRQTTSNLRIVVALTSSTREVRRLTAEARRYATPGVVSVDP